MKAVEGWKTKRLREVADIRVSNVDKKFSARENPVKLCNYMDVYTNEYVTGTIQFMEASATLAELERFGLQKGDVIITKDSETPDDIGIPTVISEQISNLVCGYHLALIRPDTNSVDSIYLAKQLSTSRVAGYFALHASGSTRYGLPVSAIEAVEIPMPSKPEQTKIAEILLTVDRAIEQTEALIAKQQRIKTGLMQDLLTCGIDEHGNLRSEQTHKFKDSPLGRIPVEWEVGEFGVYARLQGGFAFYSKHSRESGVRWLKIANVGLDEVRWEVEDFLPNEHLTKFSAFSLSEGNIVVALTRPVIRGELKIAQLDKEDVPSLLNQRVARVIPHQDMDEEFVLSLMKSRFYVAQVEDAILGTDPPNISTGQIEGIVVPVVGQEEQSRIGAFLKHQRQTQQIYSEQYSKALRLKTALMQVLLTGKKRVTGLLNNVDGMNRRTSHIQT